tara:strand:+ start:1456 stop:1686 length:231 start_codon:yes stop_codon:yes gene_type:complete
MIEKKITKIFHNVFGKKIGKNSKNLKKNKIEKWDSIGHINFIFALEENFKIKLSDSDMYKINSLDTAVKIIKKYKK